MNKKRNFTLDVVSGVDDETLERNLNKRFVLWNNRATRARKTIISACAIAASFLLIFSSVIFILPYLSNNQVPIYQGMTVSNEAPAVRESTERALRSTGRYFNQLSASFSGDYLLRRLGNEIAEEITNSENEELEIKTETYYAQKGEDIYIYVHLSNPAGYEILSFTLNGVKYSSYMFEEGSDLETLVLKYNVGTEEGLKQYTIDAIKYVDGDKVKDVRMDGDKTVEVVVGSTDQNLSFNERFNGWDLVLSPSWAESFAGERRILSLAVYDGEELIRELAPNTTVVSGLPENKRLLLVATYADGNNTVTKMSVIQTPKQSEGLAIANGAITGMGSCSDTVLYINMPVVDYAFFESTGNKHIEKIYFGAGVTSIGINAFYNCTSLTDICFSNSNGLTSIGEGTFSSCSSLNSITLPQTLEMIGVGAFGGCEALSEIVLPQSLKTIGDGAFGGCEALSEIVLPRSLKTIGDSAFGSCSSLKAVRIEGNSIEIYPSKTQFYDPATGTYRSGSVGDAFGDCPNIYFNGTTAQWKATTSNIEAWYTNETVTVHCSDGTVVLKRIS